MRKEELTNERLADGYRFVSGIHFRRKTDGIPKQSVMTTLCFLLFRRIYFPAINAFNSSRRRRASFLPI